MSTNTLHELGITAKDALRLSPRLRDHLVHFLLRWQHYAALDSCLDELIFARPLQSLLDARAQSLLEQGKLDAAWQVMAERHQRSTSIPSRILAGRIPVAHGDLGHALSAAQALVKEAPDSSMAWGFLAQVRLAMGEADAALAAYRRVNDLSPDSRSYLQGMMEACWAKKDWVAASAYGVRLQQSATAESPLPVTYLRRLREYFQASREVNRVVDIDAELTARNAAEVAALRGDLARELGIEAPSPRPRRHRRAAAAVAPGEAPTPDTFTAVSVSPQERRGLVEAAQRVFGFGDLLAGQAEIMACAARGEDVLAILPTGGGKSLCYQLLALTADASTTLVISPLIALMKDQVDKLPSQVQDLATTINSSLEGDELRRRLEAVRAGRYRLVYAAPERLRQPPFLHALRRAGINRLVIDEAHCVSMWGHDFRPDYLYIAEARRLLGNPPLLAMTATAPPRVRLDIVQRLGAMRIIAGDVLRSNLRLEVFHAHNADEKLRYLIDFCCSEPGAGIVYAGTRARCEGLAELLRCQGVSAIHYHAGLDNRAEAQDQFMSGRARVIVATIAFGMGIDKPDIRFIVHFEPSSSMEAYYQEAGRAGRDGLPARCVMLYAPSDRATLTRRAHRDELSEDFLRQVYAAIKRYSQGTSLGRVVTDDLRRDLQAEETPLRVAISLLEQVGLVRRWQDLPRSASLSVRRQVPDAEGDLLTLCRTCRLPVGQIVTRDLLDAAQSSGLDARHLEDRLLAWADAGLVECRFSARDPLLEVLPAPVDTRERMRTLLDQYEKVQAQRVAEICAYALTRRCRHGHISAYLGGKAVKRCTSCDNCRPAAGAPLDSALPDECSQLQAILRVAEHGWGRASLVRILVGDARAPAPARAREGFGALAFRSSGAIGHLVDRLLQAGFLQARHLEHGGVMLQTSAAGRQALADPARLRAITHSAGLEERLSAPVAGQRQRRSPRVDVALVADDDPLFTRLRAWRLEKAREAGVAAFVIAHNAVLRNIAAARPRSQSELAGVRGMGPRKLEKYGDELLAIVQEQAEPRIAG